MALLKQWMTEILLDVTNSEMQTVAKQVVQHEKGKYILNQTFIYLFFNVFLN